MKYKINDIDILFEDKYLLVVVKPYGVLSQDSATEKGLPDILSKYREEKGEGSYIGTPYRLDRTTQGIMVYAKDPKTAAFLSKMVMDKKLRKFYYALVSPVPEVKEGTLKDLLFYDRTKNKSYVVKRERKGVKKAELFYKIVDTKIIDNNEMSLIKVKLFTGRTHQIRCQMSNIGCPVAGDRRYGSMINTKNILLCAGDVYFIHPLTKENLHFEYKPANDYFEFFDYK